MTTLAFAVIAGDCASAADLRYRIVDLGPLPGGIQTFAYGINDLGQVVGESVVGINGETNGNIAHSRPVVWPAGGEPSLLWQESNGECHFDPVRQAFVCEEPVLPGGRPRAINNAGVIVGQAQSSGYDGTPLPTGGIPSGTAFVWDAVDGRRSLGTLGGSNSEARAINESGVVAGSANVLRVFDFGEGPVTLNVSRAFVWDEVNGMRDLGTLGTDQDFTRGADINNHGEVVGWSALPDGRELAFIWDEETGMTALSGLIGVGSSGRAVAINDLGVMAGESWNAAGTPRAVIWNTLGEIQNLGTLPGDNSSRAFSVNNHGRVIGHSQPPDGLHAFIWDSEFGMRALESLLLSHDGWSMLEVRQINNRNEIMGYGRIDDDVHAFVLIPVPEPEARALAAALVMCIAVCRLFRHRSRIHCCSM